MYKICIKINESQYIALFKVSGSIKKRHSIDCIYIYFSQSTVNCLFSFFSTLLISRFINFKQKIDFKLMSKKALLFLRKYRIIKSFCICYIVDCGI